MGGVDLAVELQKIYDNEINIRIDWLWDGGVRVRLGDEVNGFLAEENVATVAEIVPWLQEAIAHFYPASSYALSLSPDVWERGVNRLFAPQVAGAQVKCPHCGAPHAAPAGMSELYAYVCPRCGNSVDVGPPKIQ